MSEQAQRTYSVFIGSVESGLIDQVGDYCTFRFNEAYLEDPQRPVLGLRFEDDLFARHSSALRLPTWFSNLLPEGVLRDWVASDRGVSRDREMELLAQVGHDLPGAVRVVLSESDRAAHSSPAEEKASAGLSNDEADEVGWKFSLAGVALKFSMLAHEDRLTLPASGEGGDWIVKLPDARYRNVPANEFAVMQLAGQIGIEVPQTRLVHRDELVGLPDNVWPGEEEYAYAVRRFDRGPGRNLIHIEDFAQVRGKYPEDKYQGNYETVLALAYRGHDERSLVEATRRIAFLAGIKSGDAHLKNWSLIYPDQRVPQLSPAYDLVFTSPYRGFRDGPETFALKFGGSRRFETLRMSTFERAGERLGVAGLGDVANSVLGELAAVCATGSLKDFPPELRDAVSDTVSEQSALLKRTLRQ